MSSSVRIRADKKQWEKEEAAAEQAKLQTIVEAFQSSARQLAVAQSGLVKQFWSRPLADISRDGARGAGAFDDLGLPTSDASNELEVKLTKKTFDEFLTGLTARTGYTLSTDGEIRFGSFMQAQALNGVAITSQALQTCFDRLLSLGVFETMNELGYDEALIRVRTPKPQSQSVPGPTLDDIEKLDLESREGLRRAKTIVNDLASSEFAPVFSAWLDSLRNNFGFAPTDAQCRKVVELFRKHNWSFGDRRSYDKARKQMVAQFEFPESCLTAQDKLEKEVEEMDTATMSFSERRRLSRRLVYTQGQS